MPAVRPSDFRINPWHPLARGLKVAWMNRVGGCIVVDEVMKFRGTYAGNAHSLNSPEIGCRSSTFDGTGDWVILNDPLSYLAFISRTLQFSIFAQIKLSSVSARSVICGNTISYSKSGFFLMYETYGGGYGYQALRLLVTDETGAGISQPISAMTNDSVITDANWHRVMVTATAAGTVAFYLDGVKLSTNYDAYHSPRLATVDNKYTLGIGVANYSTPSLPFNGKIADLMIWDWTLSDDYCLLLTSPSLGPMYDGLLQSENLAGAIPHANAATWAGTWGG